MVFSLPGAGGGGDVGGGGDSWDRNEGDGDWTYATDKQMDRVKRLVANKQGNEIKDSEMADVEEDPELFDKKTGKKLTFQFPDALPDAASRGKGRGKRSGNKRNSEKTDVRGEEEKGNSLVEVEATATNNGMEIYDEPRGEKEKNAHEKDIYDDEPTGEREKNSPEKGEPRGEKQKNTKLNDRTDNEQKGEKEKNPQLEDIYEPEEEEDDLFDTNFEDMEVVHEYPVKKGGPPPQQKCQYELIRDQIIADREALMRAVLADIQKTSREIVEDNEKSKKRKATDAGKANKEKKKKVEKVVDIEGARRSGRERKPVNYCALDDDDDPEWEPEGKKKKVERKRKRRDNSNDLIKDRKPLPPGWNPKWNHIHNPFKKNRKNGGESSSKDKTDANSAETGRRSLRERKYVNYNFDDGPRADEFVFCERCGE